MRIKIRSSATMDSESTWNESFENKVLRVPEEAKKLFGLTNDDFVLLKTKNGDTISLQVYDAFIEDVRSDATCVYVTHKNYKKLAIYDEISTGLLSSDDIMLGCDPEAFLIDKSTKTISSAARFMKMLGEVGSDGMLIEFRPQPSIHVEQVCYTLFNLFERGQQIVDNATSPGAIDIVASSGIGPVTAGFHLHYGLPQALLGNSSRSRNIARLMTKVFDYYVGIPSILPEGNQDIYRRTSRLLAYGKPGEYRLDHRTLEFRFPGGINLVHPILTAGLLSIGATVAEDIVSRIKTCTDCFVNMHEVNTDADIKELYPNIPESKVFYSIVCNPSIIPSIDHYKGTIKKDIRSMVGYNKRANIIEMYFDCLDSRPSFNDSILKNWREFYKEY